MEEFANIPWDNETSRAGSPAFISNVDLRKYSSTYKILSGTLKPIFSDDSESDVEDGKKTNGTGKELPQKKFGLKCGKSTVVKPSAKKGYIPCFMDEKKIKYPKASALNAKQQAQYMELMIKFANKKSSMFVTQAEKLELTQYENLHEKVMAERYEFVNFVKQNCSLTQDRYLLINPDVKKYIEEAWQHRLSWVLRYPATYEPKQMLALVYADRRRSVSMIQERTLLELGSIPVVFLPKMRGPVVVQTDYPRLASKTPPDCSLPKWEQTKSLHKVPVSEDENAEKLALVNGAHIVISSSGLKHIADNHAPNFEKTWDLPVVVKEYSEKGSTKKVAYVDKALPRRSLSTVEKNLWFYKFGMRATFCHRKHSSALQLGKGCESGSMVDTAPAKSPDSSDWESVDSDENETFTPQVNSVVTKDEMILSPDAGCKMTPSSMEDTNDESDITDSESRLVIDCSDSDVSTAKRGRRNSKTSPVSSTGSDYKEDSIITRNMARLMTGMSFINKSLGQKPIQFVPSTTSYGEGKMKSKIKTELGESCGGVVKMESAGGSHKIRSSMCLRSQLEKNKKRQSKPASPATSADEKFTTGAWIPPVCGTNVSYRLWKLHKDEAQKEDLRGSFLKGDSDNREIKIIVRNRVDGYLKKGKNVERVHMTPKLEYQTEYGAQCLTQSELTADWISLYFRPDTHLCRMRVNARTSEVMMIDQRTLQEVAHENSQQTGRPNNAVLGTLYNVLLGLVNLQPGHYLLSHTPQLGAFVNLRQSVKGGRINLHDMYKINVSAKPASEVTKWIPIDYNVITPFHQFSNRVPGTFPPVRYVGGKIFAKRKKRKNKNRNRTKQGRKEEEEEEEEEDAAY